MEDVHPSATAGTGRAIRKSRYEKPGDTPEKRLECAQCGFPFNPDRDVEGDTGGDNVSGGNEIVDTEVAISNTEAGLPVHLRDVATFQESSRTVKDPVVRSGCPFCGTMNPRGQFRNDRSFDSGVDLSNR